MAACNYAVGGSFLCLLGFLRGCASRSSGLSTLRRPPHGTSGSTDGWSLRDGAWLKSVSEATVGDQ